MVSDVRFVHSKMNLHLLFSKWASCYFQHWHQSWHLLFHKNQWESIRRRLQLLSFAILWRQWTQFLIQICTEIACKTHFFWKYNDLVFFRSCKEERQVNREQRRRRRQREGQKSNRFKLTKQQLCKCITLLCTFLCRQFTTSKWKCLISRFVKNVNTRQRLSFSFPALRYII